jgi:hypothetical protein
MPVALSTPRTPLPSVPSAIVCGAMPRRVARPLLDAMPSGLFAGSIVSACHASTVPANDASLGNG